MTPTLTHEFVADGHRLVGHLSAGEHGDAPASAVVLCHGFPSGIGGGPKSAHTYPQLADRLAAETGAVVLAFNFSGCEPSDGSFSLLRWVADVRHAVTHLEDTCGVGATWVVGFGTGGAVVCAAAAADDRICGVAALGAPADFKDWAHNPASLIDHSRSLGLLGDDEPRDRRAWAAELSNLSAVAASEAIAPRPMLVLHGEDDRVVSSLDARAIADAHGSAELRIINHAGHQLRHDPRAVAILLGWLDRTLHQTPLPT